MLVKYKSAKTLTKFDIHKIMLLHYVEQDATFNSV